MLLLDTVAVAKTCQKQIRNDSDSRRAAVVLPVVENVTLCSLTYWRLEIRMPNVQSRIKHVLHVA